MGDMSDFVNDAHWGDDDSDDWYVYQGPKHCSYCGENDMEWTLTNKGWRLYSMVKRVIHSCDKHPSVANRKPKEETPLDF